MTASVSCATRVDTRGCCCPSPKISTFKYSNTDDDDELVFSLVTVVVVAGMLDDASAVLFVGFETLFVFVPCSSESTMRASFCRSLLVLLLTFL